MNLVCQEGTPFKAAAACHPGMVDPDDAPKIPIPIAILPSGDEDEQAVGEYEKNLKVPHIVEWFKDQIHGWMAARYEHLFSWHQFRMLTSTVPTSRTTMSRKNTNAVTRPYLTSSTNIAKPFPFGAGVSIVGTFAL